MVGGIIFLGLTFGGEGLDLMIDWRSLLSWPGAYFLGMHWVVAFILRRDMIVGPNSFEPDKWLMRAIFMVAGLFLMVWSGVSVYVGANVMSS